LKRPKCVGRDPIKKPLLDHVQRVALYEYHWLSVIIPSIRDDLRSSLNPVTTEFLISLSVPRRISHTSPLIGEIWIFL
jgi:hypothetical protein